MQDSLEYEWQKRNLENKWRIISHYKVKNILSVIMIQTVESQSKSITARKMQLKVGRGSTTPSIKKQINDLKGKSLNMGIRHEREASQYLL